MQNSKNKPKESLFKKQNAVASEEIDKGQVEEEVKSEASEKISQSSKSSNEE